MGSFCQQEFGFFFFSEQPSVHTLRFQMQQLDLGAFSVSWTLGPLKSATNLQLQLGNKYCYKKHLFRRLKIKQKNKKNPIKLYPIELKPTANEFESRYGVNW